MQINIEYIMKTAHIITFVISLLLIISCGITKPLPQDTNTVNVRDSIVIHQVDSIRYIPKERIVDIVPQYEVLTLETNMAKAEAWVDTTMHVLRGNIENKQGITEKIKYVDRIQYKDSIQIVEHSYPVEVEKIVHKHYWYEKFLWIISILSLAYLVIKIYFRKRV